MTDELKTLKDLTRDLPDEFGKGWPDEVNAIQLKQEAIKWVKDNSVFAGLGMWINDHACDKISINRWIMHFFNITEEDLKNE